MHRSRDDSHEDDARRIPCLEPTPSVHTHELESSLLPLPIVEVRRHRSLAHGRWKRIQQAASLLSKSLQHTNGHGIRCCLTPCMSASLILGHTSGVEQDGAVLVRPDGHVAWRARSCVIHPAETLQGVLASILGEMASQEAWSSV